MNDTKKTDTAPNNEFISLLASQLWERAGRPPGRDLEFWLQAEAGLLAAQNSKADLPATSAPTPSLPAATPKPVVIAETPKPVLPSKPAKPAETPKPRRTPPTSPRSTVRSARW